MEEINVRILRILSEDGRKSFRSIGDKLKKSPVTIKNHIEEMEDEEIIKSYGVQIDYEKLGYNIIALIELTISKGKMLEVEQELSKIPNIFAIYDITGEHDALILARFKNRETLSKMIKEKLHSSPYVERTNTHIVLNVIKELSSFNELLNERS